jgi:hypothetical protein
MSTPECLDWVKIFGLTQLSVEKFKIGGVGFAHTPEFWALTTSTV